MNPRQARETLEAALAAMFAADKDVVAVKPYDAFPTDSKAFVRGAVVHLDDDLGVAEHGVEQQSVVLQVEVRSRKDNPALAERVAEDVRARMATLEGFVLYDGRFVTPPLDSDSEWYEITFMRYGSYVYAAA